MSATGPNTEPNDPGALLTSTTGPVQTPGADVAASSIFACGFIHRIYACGAGNIAVKRANDTGFVVYPVPANFYLDGRFVAVGGSSSGTTVSTWIPEI